MVLLDKYDMDLTFRRSDLIIILEENRDDSGEMKGCLDRNRSKVGYFPVSEVDFLEEGDPSWAGSS